MARTPADRSAPTLRQYLAQASARLTAVDSPELAAYVDEVLAPGGWEQLRATDPSRRSAEGKPNLAISLPKSIRDQIWEAFEASSGGVPLTSVANEGLREYLAGRFTMPEWVDQRSVQPEERVNLNVRAPRELITQATEKIRRETGDNRASAARVAAEYLMFVFNVGRYAPGHRQRPMLARGAQRNPEMPRRVRDEIRRLAAASGDWVDDVVNEGFQKFLDGSFDPAPVVWRPEDMADMVVLKMHPNDGLFNQVKEACKTHPVLNAKTGPRTVAVAYLLEEFGLTGEAGTE